MSPPKVKVSGITRLEDARLCAGMGADHLGFDQDPASPRYVAPAVAREIVGWVEGPAPVGVFVNETAEEINRVCAEAGFRLAQLDGHEPPETVAAVGVPVIKTFRVQHDASSEQIRGLTLDYAEAADFVLLDTHRTSLWGGAGESLNWRLARELAGELRLILAGAFTAENVAEAVATMRPYAVDLSTSVEAEPGVLDFDRVADFFDAFRAATEEPEL